MKTNRSELAAAIRSGDNFLLLTHRRPDGDTLGSAAALCAGLRAIGKQAAILHNPEATEKYAPFLQGLTVDAVPAGATLFAVDMATENLLALNATELAGKIALCIDHHGSNTDYAGLTWVEPGYAACGESVLELLEELGAAVTPEMASALYLAMSTDTGCFRYSNTTPDTLRKAAQLQEAGAATYEINRQFFAIKSLARMRLETLLGEKLEVFADGKLAMVALTPEMLEQTGACDDDIEDLANFPRQIEGVLVAVYIRVLPSGEGKISVRTERGYNASAICAHLGGGGHLAAAGATVAEGLAAAREGILRAIKAETGLG